MVDLAKKPPGSTNFLLVGAALLALFAAVVAYVYWKKEDRSALANEVLWKLREASLGPDGTYWVGDVTELFRRGKITKEVAEADTAPVRPLVDRPRPFHGYFVRAMESGELGSVLKGQTQCREESAFCVYPAEAEDLSTYLVGRCSLRRKQCGANKPVLKWPSDDEIKRDWSIID